MILKITIFNLHKNFSHNMFLNLVIKLFSLLQYYKTWDNFSLSIMYLKLLFNIFRTQTNNITLFLYKLLLKNVNPNPDKQAVLMIH